VTSDENEVIRQRLRDARESIGFTQEEVSEALGIPRTSVLAMEAGTRKVSAVELRRLARLYRKNVEWLMGDEPAPDVASADQALFRATSELSVEDRDQVLRYVQFLAQGSDRAKRKLGE
jgi:transcriptional regulator with XRE-family HTH domain